MDSIDWEAEAKALREALEYARDCLVDCAPVSPKSNQIIGTINIALDKNLFAVARDTPEAQRRFKQRFGQQG